MFKLEKYGMVLAMTYGYQQPWKEKKTSMFCDIQILAVPF